MSAGFRRNAKRGTNHFGWLWGRYRSPIDTYGITRMG
jgi:hypothetical protein